VTRQSANRKCASFLVATVGITVGVAAPAFGQLNREIPSELRGVDIVEKPNAKLPLDLPFKDEDGNDVTLGDYFKSGSDGVQRPVVLQLGYLKCPMLCNLVLNGAIEGLQGVDWTAGTTFELVSVSINPTETHQLAKVKREGYLLEYNRKGAEKGFHFLTGPASSSHALADAVGFGFRDQGDGDYAHAAVIFVITPDGRVSRYLYGTTFEPGDIRFALLEASEGKIGTTLDRFILWCHFYDPDAKGYVLSAQRVMKVGGALMFLVLAAGLGWLWRGEHRRRRAAPTAVTPIEPAIRASTLTHSGTPTGN
jgi:protein SCO1